MKAIVFIIKISFLVLCGSAKEEAKTKTFPIKFESRVIDVKMIPQGGIKKPILKRWIIRVEVPKELKEKIRPATVLEIHVSSPTRFLRSAEPHEGKMLTIECAVLRPVLTDLECRATAKK